MKIGGIPDPFSGEKIAEIYPRLAPFVEETPRLGRLHYFPGRHLTDAALEREQAVRVERLELRGRSVTSGIVNGLEVTWRTINGRIAFVVSPGHALTEAGTDMVVDRTIEVPYEDLKFYDHANREVSDLPLGLNENGPRRAYAAVLVLQRGFVNDADLPLAVRGETDDRDFTPCPRVPEDEVYYRTTSTDAGRLIVYPLPWDESPGLQWQNRIAWAIFNREAAGEKLPWTPLGVPLAVIGFNDALTPEWIDRHAVMRQAGRPRQRVLIQPTFDARVWHARFNQFCAQLSTLTQPLAGGTLFQFLPPVGLLPKVYLTLQKRAVDRSQRLAWDATQHFFPTGYTTDVSVVPLEQLDALIADSVRLEPYDLSHSDAVRLLLPVSQQWFDPDLLKIEQIDPRFEEYLIAYRARRGEWLARRYDLAQRRQALELANDGQTTAYPLTPDDPDPLRLESPEEPIGEPPGEATQFGVTRTNSGRRSAYSSDLVTQLRESARTFLKAFSAEDLEEFTQLFEACGINREQAMAAFSPGEPPRWLARLAFDGTDKTLSPVEKDELRRELLAYIKKQIEVQEAEAKTIESANVQELITYFTTRTDEADEMVDAGFLKMRTDVFRLGNLLSNSSLSSKFTASASLANIIERKPPKTDSVGVNAFASQLLANFAPSMLASTATAPSVVSPPVAGPALNTRLETGRSVNVATSKSLYAKEYLNAVDRTSTQIEASREEVKSVNEKLLGANSPLTEDEKKTYSLLRDSAVALSSAGALTQLQDVVEVSKFADNYVANFDLLSQKQIRAIPLERLQPALAPAVRQEIHDGRLEIFERLTRLDLSLGDLTTDFVDVPGTPVRPPVTTKVTRIRFQTLISHRHLDTLSVLTQTAANTTAVNDADESRHFSSGVAYADMAMAALRAVETRIKEYRAFITQCRAVLKRASGFGQEITRALAPVEVELNEARQDVAVALALMAEEQARLDVINARREKVLRDQVEFVVFHRPRAVALNTDVPIRRLEPALTSAPVVDCIRENPTPPADLAGLRDIFQSSPARWFKHAPHWIEKVDRWEHLRSLLDRAARTPVRAIEPVAPISSGRFTTSLGKLYQARQTSTQKYVLAAPALNLAGLNALSWVDLRGQAERQLTLGQLISSGPAPLSKAASEELDHLFIVATCLHGNFSSVPGLVRLTWAERFGQLDTVAVDFRDLSRLPSWPTIDFTLRREMQIHVDWLFGRIDQTQPEAVDLINDLIRVALLLASHAPVDQLIVGHPLESEIIPRPGGLIKLKVDPLQIRRGMNVFYQVSATQTLRAVVEDISASHVSARIEDVPTLNTGSIKLTPASTFQFRNAAR